MTSPCPGCGGQFPGDASPGAGGYLHSAGCWACYGELTAYHMEQADPSFPHQLAVDAYGAQHAGAPTRAVTVAYALVGLHLALECGFTGKQVQRAHMLMRAPAGGWPRWPPPAEPACYTVRAVRAAPAGAERDAALRAWAVAVWEGWAGRQDEMRALATRSLG